MFYLTIMKKLMILLITCNFYALTIKAQNYHPIVDTNKVWSVLNVVYGAPPNYDSSYNTKFIKFGLDTIINTLCYKEVLETYNVNLINWTSFGYIREDTSKKVFFIYDNNGETLLYDFNANINDTIALTLNPPGFVLDSVVVDSIDSISLSGEYRKRFFIRSLNCNKTDIWIEGVGSFLGVIYSYTLCYVGGSTKFLCYYYNDTLQYHNPNYSDCYIITDNKETKKNIFAIQISPNPASNFTELMLTGIDEFTKSELLLYDIYGRKVWSNIILGLGYSFSVKQFTQGIYYLNVKNDKFNKVLPIIIK